MSGVILNSGFDVAIVGGGVIGAGVAWRLQQRGARVVLIDAGAAAPAATNAAAGMLAPSFESGGGALEEALYSFSRRSLSLWRDFARALEADSGLEIDYHSNGILGVACSEEEARRLQEDYESLRARGADVSWLSRDEALREEPQLGAAVLAAMMAEKDGQVDPPRVLEALRVATESAGGEVVSGQRVRELIRTGERIDGVVTQSGERIAAGMTLVASGAFSISSAGIGDFLTPVKGEALSVAGSGTPLRRVVRGSNAYLCPKADGRLVIGATEAPGETSLDPAPDAIERLRSAAAHIAPLPAAAPEWARWAGLRPGTRDGAPIIGPAENGAEGLIYALGHYRNGVLLAPATAEALTKYCLDGTVSPEIEAFTPARFQG